MGRNSHIGFSWRKLEQAFRPEHEGRDRFAAMQRLALAVDDTGLNEVDDAVRKHLSVNAEVAAVVQTGEHGFRNAADPRLQRRAVGNERGDVARHLQMQVSELFGTVFEQRAVGFDDRWKCG